MPHLQSLTISIFTPDLILSTKSKELKIEKYESIHSLLTWLYVYIFYFYRKHSIHGPKLARAEIDFLIVYPLIIYVYKYTYLPIL